MGNRALLPTAVALLTFALVAPGPAAAHRKVNKVEVSLLVVRDDDKVVFINQLLSQKKSVKRACFDARDFVVKRKQKGRDRVVARGRTNRDGSSRAEVRNLKPGKYYEKLKKEKFGHGGRHVCKGAKSNVVKVKDA